MSCPVSSRAHLLKAFTLVEILLVVGVIAILGGVAVVTISSSRESTRVSKLESDVATINAAIQVYQVSGGALPQQATPQEVLDALKTTASDSTTSTLSGLRGSMVDLRLQTEMQSADEASTSQQRAIWNGERFVVTASGDGGVKNFVFGDVDGGQTSDRTATVKQGTGDWVWNYEDVAASPKTAMNGPGTEVDPDRDPLEIRPKQLLLEPTFEPSDSNQPLSQFDPDLSVSVLNPNDPGTSRLFVNGVLYKNALPIGLGGSISAQAKTSDPDHWITSTVASKTYQAIPVAMSVAINAPSSMTYKQAGGVMADNTQQTPPVMTFSLSPSDPVPLRYMNSGNVNVVYHFNGVAGEQTNTFENGYVSPEVPLGLSAWQTSPALVISAQAVAHAPIFTAASPTTKTVGIAPLSLPEVTIDPPTGAKAAAFPVTLIPVAGESLPAGYRIFYTLDGSDPGNNGGNPVNGTLYTGQFDSGTGLNGIIRVRARIYGPAGYGQWFTPGPTAATNYSYMTIPTGAFVGSATINDGTFNGSLIFGLPPSGQMQSLEFYGKSKIMKGNLYLPGTPNLYRSYISPESKWTEANASKFSSTILGWEFDAQGERVGSGPVPPEERVVNEDGDINPQNYNVTFYSTAVIEGKVFRRHTPPPFPVVPNPPPPDSNKSKEINSPSPGPFDSEDFATITINGGGADTPVRLLGGINGVSKNYNTITANSGSTFVLGDPDHPEVTQYYSFSSLQLNSSSKIQIVGKVVITVKNGFQINAGSIIGNSEHPEWLQLQVSSGDVSANSGSAIYAQLVVPTKSVTFNAGSAFFGSVVASKLTISSNGVFFVLPPVIQ